MEFKIIAFKDLDISELYQVLKLRADIFVVEQNCVYNDLDGNDELGYHLLAFDNNMVIGYARMLPKGTRFKAASIGRLVVKSDYRRKGLASSIMKKASEWVFNNWGVSSIDISAQKYLEVFYTTLGYRKISNEYLEDGIPHIKMKLSKLKKTSINNV